MTDDTTPHGLRPPLPAARRRGARGGGRDQRRPGRRTRSGRPGPRTRLRFQGTFKNPKTPDWHYLPFQVPHGVRAIEVRYDFRPTTPASASAPTSSTSGSSTRPGKGLGNAARLPRLVRRRPAPLPAQPPLGDAGLPGRPDHAGPLARHPRPVPDHRRPVRRGTSRSPSSTARRPSRRSCRIRAPVAVPGTGAGWYRGDLHIHTVHSDGHWTPGQLVAQARTNGLDFLGTSDHNTNTATRVFGRTVPDDFLVVSGEEVTTRNGHWLATGTTPGHLGRLALPGRRPPARAVHRPDPQRRRRGDRRPPVRAGRGHPLGLRYGVERGGRGRGVERAVVDLQPAHGQRRGSSS